MVSKDQKPRITTKSIIANEIIMFVKSIKYSLPLAILIFIILYVFVFKVPDSRKPDISGVQVENTGIFVTINYGNTRNQKILNYAEFHKNPYYYGLSDINFYDNTGSDFNTERLISQISRANYRWATDKTKLSVFISLIILIGIPILFVLFRSVVRMVFNSKRWVNDNRTI